MATIFALNFAYIAFFLPIFPSKPDCSRNFSHMVLSAATILADARMPMSIDKLSLTAYDAQTVTLVSVPRVINATNSRQHLSVTTSTMNSTVNIPSAFPITPSTLRCLNSQCQTSIPVTSCLAITTRLRERPLCDEHDEQFLDAEEHHGQTERVTASAKNTDISENIASCKRSGAESRWDSDDRDMARRTSSSAYWRSFASWESDDAEFEWDARAFNWKLCW